MNDSTPYLSEIFLVAFNFAPRDYALCNGQLLPINQNQALFSLLGTAFGGDGRVNFALPNLRGRIPMHQDAGHIRGTVTGKVTTTVTVANLPVHEHGVTAVLKLPVGAAANTDSSANAYPAPVASSSRYSDNADEQMATVQGGDLAADTANGALATETNPSPNTPVNNMMPYLTLNYIIALTGIFPSTT
ncbi:phage tail protein [Chitinophaga sp. RCC_12]|uniref:phage tail protein n=1 Tax=Chitinophaga sp. RCC_12 TaxID=3239226 RepID=UPI0035257316